MNQTIRTYRQLHAPVHQNEARALKALIGERRIYGTDEKHAGKTLWGEIKAALMGIAVFAFLVVAAVVIRLVAFHPGFVEMLERTGRLLAMGLPL